MKPVHIFVGGSELIGWTSMTLHRSKEELTGSLNVEIFMGFTPDAPVLVDAAHGKQILVYVGGHIAFTGLIDKRVGAGVHGKTDSNGRTHGADGRFVSEAGGAGESGGDLSLSIGPNDYSITLSARGKTKYLIDSSNQHPTTNMKQPTNRQVVDKLVEPFKISVDWMATEVSMNRTRFRDGSRVVDELHRVGLEHCHFIYETRDGNLRITDDVGPTTGEPLVLGTNILSFQAEQSESEARAKIKVKGQRTRTDIWGKDAVAPTIVEIEDQWVTAFIPVTVQHYGDATPEALQRRATFEANKRSSMSKKLTIEVFHVQSTNGEPWDIGQLHYVEVPPEGIFNMFECTELMYTVENDKTLKTTLTLSPPPVASSQGTGTFPNLPEIGADLLSPGGARQAMASVTFSPGTYPQPWAGPQLALVNPLAVLVTAVGSLFLSDAESDEDRPPAKLPDGYDSEDRK